MDNLNTNEQIKKSRNKQTNISVHSKNIESIKLLNTEDRDMQIRIKQKVNTIIRIITNFSPWLKILSDFQISFKTAPGKAILLYSSTLAYICPIILKHKSMNILQYKQYCK